jgi:ribosomal protein S18 acetylase RimI-like enzyme
MTDADLGFVAGLYASTRAEELAPTGWPPEAKLAFLLQQHDAQHRHYRNVYDGAEWLIVEQESHAIGRLYRVIWPAEIRIIDISLVPEARGRGIGAAILRDIQAEAEALGRSVTIHVEKNNPARSLYERLGFGVVEDKGVYDLMKWSAPAQ